AVAGDVLAGRGEERVGEARVGVRGLVVDDVRARRDRPGLLDVQVGLVRPGGRARRARAAVDVVDGQGAGALDLRDVRPEVLRRPRVDRGQGDDADGLAGAGRAVRGERVQAVGLGEVRRQVAAVGQAERGLAGVRAAGLRLQQRAGG